jgi:heme exporter protein D
MNLGPHADFIILAYAVAGAVVGALIAWILLDYRAQKVMLADLEARRVTRRQGDVKPAVNVGSA